LYSSSRNKKKKKRKRRHRRRHSSPPADKKRKNDDTKNCNTTEAAETFVSKQETSTTVAPDGKIYPKCLPKHALKSLTPPTEDGSGGDKQLSDTKNLNNNNNKGGEKKAVDVRKKVDRSRFKNGTAAAAGVVALVADEDSGTSEEAPFCQDGKKIVFSKIEDIPTRPDSPASEPPLPPPVWPPLPPTSPPRSAEAVLPASRKKFEANTFVAASAETRKQGAHAHNNQLGVNNNNNNNSGGAGGAPRLKFGLTLPSNKRLLQAGGGSASTFAELSNKLGPMGYRKNGLKQPLQQESNKPHSTSTFVSAAEVITTSSSGRLPPLKEHIRQIEAAVAAEVASTAAAAAAVVAAVSGSTNINNNVTPDEADAATDVVDMELEESFESSNSRQRTLSSAEKEKKPSSDGPRGRDSRSRSRSRRSRGRGSQSRSSFYSRSQSRDSYSSGSSSSSRSRSRSYSSYSSSYSSRSRSRSRTRTRSPSIQRRRGSPSFLDKRRITR
jgi:hypothetical protein